MYSGCSSLEISWVEGLEKVRTDGGRREKVMSSPKIFTILLATGISKARFMNIDQHLLFCTCSTCLGPVHTSRLGLLPGHLDNNQHWWAVLQHKKQKQKEIPLLFVHQWRWTSDWCSSEVGRGAPYWIQMSHMRVLVRVDGKSITRSLSLRNIWEIMRTCERGYWLQISLFRMDELWRKYSH